MAVDPAKVEVVSRWSPPTNVTEIKSFLGFAGYYRRFIEGFSKIAKPLTRLTQKEIKFEWTNELYAKFKKCNFWLTEISFLGHIISKEGVAVDPAKVEVVSRWSPPTNVTEIKHFLGFAGYYRRFIEGFFKVAKPLTRLTQKEVKFE